jgi:hypothetical protein
MAVLFMNRCAQSLGSDRCLCTFFDAEFGCDVEESGGHESLASLSLQKLSFFSPKLSTSHPAFRGHCPVRLQLLAIKTIARDPEPIPILCLANAYLPGMTRSRK